MSEFKTYMGHSVLSRNRTEVWKSKPYDKMLTVVISRQWDYFCLSAFSVFFFYFYYIIYIIKNNSHSWYSNIVPDSKDIYYCIK